MRVGRGGRRHLDRRLPGSRSLPSFLSSNSSDSEEVNSDGERMWRYDEDDVPAVGPQGLDEQDRVLVDDYATR